MILTPNSISFILDLWWATYSKSMKHFVVIMWSSRSLQMRISTDASNWALA